MADTSEAHENRRGGGFDPPSDVVDSAFVELLRRLRIYTYSQDAPRSLSEADKAIFSVGYQARKRVFQNTLGLILGQWTLYRAVIRNLPRSARMLYGVGSVFATGQYVQSSAYKVTRDMFAKIVNLPEESPLGNEARIILADLEGPDGPYYVSVVDDSMRRQIYDRITFNQSDKHTYEDLHPQLALRPRLLSDSPSKTMIRQGTRPNIPISATGLEPSMRANASPADFQNQVARRHGWRDDDLGANNIVDITPELYDADDVPWLPQSVPQNSSSKPFDFAAAARVNHFEDVDRNADDFGERDNYYEDTDLNTPVDGIRRLTPSQKRAAERLEKRRRAKQVTIEKSKTVDR